MSSPAPAKPQTRFPAETWARIKAEACAGASYPALSLRYGPQRQVISNRAKAEQWPTPLRLKRLRNEADRAGGIGDEVAPAKSKTKYLAAVTKNNEPEYPEQLTKDSVSKFHAALLDLVNSPPADFQTAFAAVAQSAIAEGVRDVPAPRSIKELATWFDLWRKAAGLDAKAGTPGSSPLVNPLRTVSRRAVGPVVDVPDAAPVDIAPVPVPGSDEWESWEV